MFLEVFLHLPTDMIIHKRLFGKSSHNISFLTSIIHFSLISGKVVYLQTYLYQGQNAAVSCHMPPNVVLSIAPSTPVICTVQKDRGPRAACASAAVNVMLFAMCVHHCVGFLDREIELLALDDPAVLLVYKFTFIPIFPPLHPPPPPTHSRKHRITTYFV